MDAKDRVNDMMGVNGKVSEALEWDGRIEAVIQEYVGEVKRILGGDFVKALLFGSYARGEQQEDSDIDIAIFTNRPAGDIYELIHAIAEPTFEYNVKYNVMLAPVLHNIKEFYRRVAYVPFYQSIEREGIAVG